MSRLSLAAAAAIITLPLSSRASGKGRSTGKVGKDYRLRELDRKGKKVKVRDLFGREGWVDDADLEQADLE